MEYCTQRANEIMQEYQTQGDWEKTHKAGILLYIYADKLIQMSIKQKKEQERIEKEMREERYYVDTKKYKKE